MAAYVICYELQDPSLYQRVWDILEGWGAVRLLESAWVLGSDDSALDLRNALRQAIGPEDAIAIVEIRPGSWWACENAEAEGLDWLRRRILA